MCVLSMSFQQYCLNLLKQITMTFQQRQSQLIEQITHVNDENILIMLEQELSYHLQNRNGIHLSDFDLNELISLADEPDDKDIVSEYEYKKATDKWRLK